MIAIPNKRKKIFAFTFATLITTSLIIIVTRTVEYHMDYAVNSVNRYEETMIEIDGEDIPAGAVME